MVLDKLGQPEPAATFAGFAALSQMTVALYPELTDLIIRLREALGHQTYAYEQMDHARAQLQQLR